MAKTNYITIIPSFRIYISSEHTPLIQKVEKERSIYHLSVSSIHFSKPLFYHDDRSLAMLVRKRHSEDATGFLMP